MGSNSNYVMESNGIISFEVQGKTYQCTFGMKCAEIFGNFLIEQEPNGRISDWDWFVGVLYAGWVNDDYNERRPYITFKEVSLIADQLEKDVQTAIYNCYENSKPGREIQKEIDTMVGFVQKKNLEIKEQNQSQQIGQQLESTPPKTESDTGNLPA